MSSKRHIRRKSCEGKRQFSDHASAFAAASSYWHTFNQPMNAYRCRFCNHFHIGHPSREVRQAMRARREEA